MNETSKTHSLVQGTPLHTKSGIKSILCQYCVIVQRYLDNDTIFVALLMHTSSVDFKSTNQDVIEEQTLILIATFFINLLKFLNAQK